MKVRNAFVFLCFLFYCVSNCFANNIEQFDSTRVFTNEDLNEKIYISPEVIHLNQNQILVNVNGQLLSVPNISVDKNGYYLSIDEVLTAMGQEQKSWTCRWCGRRNTMNDRWCARCGRSWTE
jgi:hypothetical protein